MLVFYLFSVVELRALQRLLCIVHLRCAEFVSFRLCTVVHVCVVSFSLCVLCRVLRAAEVVGSYFTESWFPAPETQILFSRPLPLCS